MEQSMIKINTQLLDEDSVSVNKYLKDLLSKKEDLYRSVTALNQMWSGDAYDAFVKAVNDDLAALQIVIDNLTQVYRFEQTAKSEYEICEARVAKLVDEISIREV